ncbi:DUF1192 domain-containing protein [Terrihabitans sp. B22-R8]|uniref:DUF1192 domain-containing protein n=1 Tax=Terrihabitans sp. B22-R8 TaxID=3425128 RepID=UPI00403D1705
MNTDFTDELPVPRPAFAIGMPLSDLSVDEISACIEALRAEIERLDQARTQKAAHLSAADQLFGSRG